eukprot:2917637-Pyramimonas_sp.AAC.1
MDFPSALKWFCHFGGHRGGLRGHLDPSWGCLGVSLGACPGATLTHLEVSRVILEAILRL